MGGHKINIAPGGSRERDMSNGKSCIKGFVRLPLEVQAYVKSEIALQIKKATHSILVSDAVIRHRESIAGWIKFFCYILLAGAWVVGSWLFAPTVIKKMVDEKVTIPEIKGAAHDVLEQSLAQLAGEKMVPFERRAEELHVSLSNSEKRVAALEKEFEVFSDISLARMYNRDAFQRISDYSRGDGRFSRLCRMEIKTIREELLLKRSATDYLVIVEHGVDGKIFSGPFTEDEIYDRYVGEREDPLGSVNAMRARHSKCFDLLLLDVANRCKNLKTAESALAFLEKLGAPHTDVWRLGNVSNWVAKTVAKEPQFPQKEYEFAMSKLVHEGARAARPEILDILDRFKSLEKLRTIAIVEALSRSDLDGAKSLYGGYVDKNTRWRRASDCYFMSVTGGVDHATKNLIECCKQYSSLILQLDSRPWWMMSRFFNMRELKDWVMSQRE